MFSLPSVTVQRGITTPEKDVRFPPKCQIFCFFDVGAAAAQHQKPMAVQCAAIYGVPVLFAVRST
jgi:hypothetical protein